MRLPVALLAAFSAATPATLLVAAALPVLVPISGPSSRTALIVALFLLPASSVARAILFRRFAASEQAIVRFWAFAPTLALLVTSTLAALPVLALHALRAQIGRAGLFALATAVAIAAGAVVWVVWLRFRDSLAPADT